MKSELSGIVAGTATGTKSSSSTSDDTPGGPRGRAQRPAGPAALLYRHAVVLPVLDPRAGAAVPADRRRARSDGGSKKITSLPSRGRPGRRAGDPLEVLAPLARDLPARLHVPRRRRRLATPARGWLRPGDRADPGHSPEMLRLLRGTVIPPPRRDRAHRLHWSAWRRRHQHGVRQAHRCWNAYAEPHRDHNELQLPVRRDKPARRRRWKSSTPKG